MGFVDKAKTILLGDQNNRQDHGFRAGFVPTIAPSLVAAGAIAAGAPVAAVAVGFVGAGVFAVGAGVFAVGAGAFAAGAGAFAAGAGAFAAGAFAGVAAVCAAAAGAAAIKADEKGYNFKRHLTGELAGCALGATLVFNVVAGLLQEQPKAPVAGPVPSTLEIKPSGGGLCKNFNVAETTDAAGRLVYTLTVPDGCTVPAAAAAVPR